MLKFMAAVTTSTVVMAQDVSFNDAIRAEHEVLSAFMEEQMKLPKDLRSCEKGVARDKKAAPDITYFKRARVRVPRSG